MPTLRIELLPLEQSVRNARTFNETLIQSAREALVAQRINGIRFGASVTMQCVLWVCGSQEAMAAVQAFLDRQNIHYTAYEGMIKTPETHTA